MLRACRHCPAHSADSTKHCAAGRRFNVLAGGNVLVLTPLSQQQQRLHACRPKLADQGSAQAEQMQAWAGSWCYHALDSAHSAAV